MSKWSEVRKKAKENEERLHRIPFGTGVVHKFTRAVAQRDDITETEDLKRREQEMTKDLKYLAIRAIGRIRTDFSMLIKGEEEAIKMYEYAVDVYKPFGWGGIFSDILKDEREHLEKLRICLRSIEEVYQREGGIKST